jgi:Glyoxalase/Bleomycin resistance protein/Dioxygenase superfamily
VLNRWDDRSVLEELVVSGGPEPWRGLGFAAGPAGFQVGTVHVRLDPEADGGIVAWSLRGVSAQELDGMPTRPAAEAPGAPRAEHPNGALSIDHVVVATPDLERTIGALEEAGLSLRRRREATTAGGPVHQAFLRVGEVVLELVQHPGVEAGPARFWGMVFTVADIDACGAALGERLGEVRAAVQRGRRIATVRREAGLPLPVALMSPDPRLDQRRPGRLFETT